MTEHHTSHETLAQRKERLKLQCRAYRAAAGHSRKLVHEKLSARAIATTAVGLLGVRAQTAFGNVASLFDRKQISAGNLRKMLPLLASGYSLLSRRSLLKPILRGALVVGTAGAAVYFYSRRKAAKKAHEHVAIHERL